MKETYEDFSFEETKKMLIESGTEPKKADSIAKEHQWMHEIDDMIVDLRNLPDDEWRSSDNWYELVVACYKYKCFRNRQLNKKLYQ